MRVIGQRAITNCLVLLVEDNAAMRRTVRALLKRRLEVDVLPAATLAEARAHIVANASRIGAAVVDIGLGGEDGLDLVPLLHRCGIPAVAYTGRSCVGVMRRAFRAGCEDVFLKGEKTEPLVASLRRLCLRWRPSPGLDVAAKLTPRQLEVARLVRDGLDDAQIAAALGVAEPTVRRHVAALLSRADCESRTALVVLLRARLRPADR